MKRTSLIARAVLAWAFTALPVIAQEGGTTPAIGTPPPAPPAIATSSTADHTKFEILQQSFASGEAVTKACLTCHDLADDQIMHSIHFTWDYQSPTGQRLGKSNVINAFCGNVVSNEPRCTSCHAGYGWDDMNTPASEADVTPDCLVCHDRSGQYTKTATGAGAPPLDPVKPGTKTITGALAWPVDLTRAAQSVGMPGRDNCGNCHFYGGGGDNVKHGDLSSVLYEPAREVDVHMSPDGGNFTCATCHVEDKHQWAGSRYDLTLDTPIHAPGATRTAATCESCHSARPHKASLVGMKLNDHTETLACETCHIPSYARGGVATKTLWDWSTAARLDDQGKPIAIGGYEQGDGRERHTYLSQKGNFAWGENVTPTYAWFNGHVEYTLPGDKIDPEADIGINEIAGGPGDGKIFPFKLMHGKQVIDPVNRTLAFNQAWGPTTDTALWTNFDWSKSVAAGMEAAGAPYSGEYAFAQTHMWWPTTHMVAPAADAVQCEECHAEGGRMQGLAGLYMPGTNPRSPVGLIGMALVLLTLIGVAGHWLIRRFAGKKQGGGNGPA